MTKLEIFEKLYAAAFKAWPSKVRPCKHGGLLIREDYEVPVLYGIELIVTIAKATGCSFYITVNSGWPEVRVYE